ncbi:hypothetical protein PIB30_036884, partial [Stylosanthes scabra]|nr:hypothetical protein [Stylosanthes scabra]
MVRRKRKNLEGHRIQSKRTRKRGNPPTHSNAESANQFLHDNEEPNQPPEEEGTQLQPPPRQPQPHQLHKKRPIPATQYAIEIHSDGEDPEPRPNKMLIPKVETGVDSSPASMLIADVLMSMADDEAPELHHEEESQPDPSMPSFSLNFDNPTPQADEQTPPKAPEMEEEFPLTTRTMAVIKSLDEQVSANAPALETPQQIQEEDDDFQERVATWATVPNGGNDYELIFDLRGPRTLEAMRCQFDSMAPKSYIDIQVVGLMCHILNGEEGERYEKMVYCIPPEILTRMLEAHHHNWIDKKKRRPHEINTLVNHKEYLSFIDREKILSHRFSCTQHWWLYVLDKNGPEGPEMFVLDSKNISSPTEERTTLNKFAPMLMEFRKKLVAKIILSKENTKRSEAIRAAHEMRRTKPSAAL